jgi:hypothetical protein
MAELRQRRRKAIDPDTKPSETFTEVENEQDENAEKKETGNLHAKEEHVLPPSDQNELQQNKRHPHEITHVVAKWTILRLTGMVYFIAFLGAYYQNRGLMGSKGLQPAIGYLEPLQQRYSSSWEGFLDHPTLFWWVDLTDDRMEAVQLAGIIISSLVVLGEDSMILMFLLWALYFSIVTTAQGTSFYNYGWEMQLLETGFLAMFLCDFFPQVRVGRRAKKSHPSQIVLWLFRWLCFRISLGAGLIKIRGDSCWTQKTCLFYHFETQPIPSPLSFIFHFLPKWALKHAVDLDLFVQLYTSFFVLLPSTCLIPGMLGRLLLNAVRLGGFTQAGFMINIILSGNFAFLNHLTIIPALACLDDSCWPSFLCNLAWKDSQPNPRNWRSPRMLLDLGLLALIASLSWPVIDNLFQLSGTGQQMNASFDRFRLVNTYGAFGSVGKGRYEPIVSITYNGREWHELEFPCKPGNVVRRPCFCAPYHYRLDWNIWFIGFKPHMNMLQGREVWLFSLIAKLMDKTADERPWLDLLDVTSSKMLRENYEHKFMTPIHGKVDMYHYEMAAPLWEILTRYLRGEQDVVWWNRTFEEVLIPPVEVDQQQQRLKLVNVD